MTDWLMALTSEFAASFQIPVWTLRGLILTESGGDNWAMRYEPGYRYLVNVRTRLAWKSTTMEGFPSLPGVSQETEWIGQKTSWGLMQVMGGVARERGYAKLFLSGLCDVRENLQIGCGLLKEHLEWAGGDEPQALGAYNAGRKNALGPDGQLYSAKVIAAGKRLEHA